MLSALLASGCAIVTRGSDYCLEYLDYIKTGEYEKAYDMLADSIKAPESAEEREARLKEENKEKEENKQIWREIFGLDRFDKTEEPTATPVPATPTPEEEQNEFANENAAVVPDDSTVNGATPDPETGEIPVSDETPPPDLSNINSEGEALGGGDGAEDNLPDESDIPADQREDDPTGTPDPNATTAPAQTPAPADTPAPTPTPDPDATADPDATPSPAPTEAPAEEEEEAAKTISKAVFVSRYESLAEELELTGIDYTVTDQLDGEIVARVSYDLTYHSARAGTDLTYSFTVTANRIEHRWTIDWSPSLIFPQMEWGDSIRVGTLQANRGEILCSGEAYAQNVPTVTVFCIPSTIPNVETFIEQVTAVSELELDETGVRESLKNQRNDFAKLQTFYPDELTADLKLRLLNIDGLAIDTANYGTLRYYPFGKSLCHIIGYAGIISKKEKINYEAYGDIIYDRELRKFISTPTRYNGDSYIGKYGLELLYENDLLGTNGRFTYIQTKEGGSRGMLYSTPAVDGNDLHLTILPELQERLEQVIETSVYDDKIYGSVVVLNPKTGAIQAMTSWPGFDLNYLSRGMPPEEWEALQTDPTIPLYNRATQGLYTPGSVFKTMTSAALLETNTMTMNDVFPQSEEIDTDAWYPSETFLNSIQQRASDESWEVQSADRALVRTRSDSRKSPMNLHNSIVSSDNLFFSYAAMRMGWTRFEDFLINKLGWNTAIQLEVEDTLPRVYWTVDPNDTEKVAWQNVAEGGETIWEYDEDGNLVEKQGVHLVLDKMIDGMDVSQPQLYNAYDPDGQNDYDLAVTGYGQGQILLSPLQMACYVSAYANDGDIMQPYIVDSLWHTTVDESTGSRNTGYELAVGEDGSARIHEPAVYKHLLQKSTVDMLLPALREVCTDGTARSMTKSFINRNPLKNGYRLAGKTGTAEINNDKTKELAWFVCWRDADDNGVPVTAENARLVCVMLEIDLLTAKTEWQQMKYDIARAILNDSILNDDVSLIQNVDSKNG